MNTEPAPAPRSWRDRLADFGARALAAYRRWYARRKFYVWLAGFSAVFLLLALSNRIFFTIPSGHAGVKFERFGGGTVTSAVRDEGFQIICPWDTLTIYDVRVQQVSHTFDVISRDGLSVGVTLSIRYRPRLKLLGVLHREVGPNYLQTIVIPEVQALARTTFGAYTPEEMYTTRRSLIEETLSKASGQVGERYVSLDDLLVKEIKLPPQLKAAIENKLIEQQNSLAMAFRIDRERQEAERKAIEATGVARFNDLVRAGLDEDLLRYKGIEATLKLAESANAKVVVIGDSHGLPLILDTSSGTRPATDLRPASAKTEPGSAVLPAATPDSLNASASPAPAASGPIDLRGDKPASAAIAPEGATTAEASPEASPEASR